MINIYGIRTTHELAQELLSKPNNFVTVLLEDREYSIESIKTVKTHANIDDEITHKTIVCNKMSGNLI